jgi:hypothetical protein
MPRAKKTWTNLLVDIRLLLGETTAANSAWSDALLLLLWNVQIDLRSGQLADVQEDWLSSTISLSLVANQAAYALPAGSNSVKRVLRVVTEGGVTRKIPVPRFEPWMDEEISSGATNSATGYAPTYRLLGGNLILSPAPGFSLASGIEVETEPFIDHFTGGSDALPASYPDILETLLKVDTAVAAIRIEGSLGEDSEGGYINHLLGMRAELEQQFLKFIEKRQQSLTFTRRVSFGA